MKYVVFVILLLIQSQIYADSDADSVKYKFNPLVVTATKVRGAQRDIAASVSVLDESMIEQATTYSALELVKNHVPGVFITERSVMGYGIAEGAAGGISIRGIGGSPVTGVLVLRDGRPDIMGMMGHPLPDAYSLNGIERIEVVRGPASFLYGTNAMGGVINLVSKKMTQDGFETSLNAGGGNFNSQKFNVRHGGKRGAFEYIVTANRQTTDGHRPNSDYEGNFFTAHFGTKMKKTLVELNANYSFNHLLDPGTLEASFIDHWYDIARSGADLTVNHQSNLGDSYFKLHGNFGRHRIYDGWRSNDRTIGVMVYHNAQLWGGNTSTIGFDVKNYGGDGTESLNPIPVINYDARYITEYAPYFHMQQLLYSRFIASGGFRIEQHPLYGSEVTPKVGLVFHASSMSSFRISAAKGFRSPSIRELYVFPPRNESLSPERMWNYELGWNQQISERLKLEAVVFRSQGDNTIRMQFAGGTPKFVNSGEFEHRGYELLLNWHPHPRMSLSTSWSDMDLGDETQGSPEKKWTASLGYDFGKVGLTAHIMHAADLFGEDDRQDKLADFTLLNVSATADVWRGIGLKAWLKNALDQEYQIVSGYPMPGRTFMAELMYSF